MARSPAPEKATSYLKITKQIAELQRQAEALKKAEIAEVVAKIREAIDAYGLTAEDLGFAGKRAGKARASKVGGQRRASSAPSKLYRNADGREWAGRGPRPQWLREALAEGHQLEEFRV